MTARPGSRRGEAQRAIGAMFFLIGALNASWVGRVPAIRQELGLSDRDLGLLLLAPAAGALLAFRFAGALTARYGSRRMVQVSTATLCLLLAFPALAPSPWWAALAFAAFGACSGVMDVAINANAVELERRIDRSILGSLHGLACAGRLAGAAGAALAAWQGLPPALHLVIAAVSFELLAVAMGRRLLSAAGSAPPGASAAPAAPTGPPAPADDRLSPSLLLLGLGAVCFCSSASEGAMADWAAVYLRDTLGTGEALAASAYALFSLAMLGGRFAADAMTARLGATGLVRLGGALVALALALGLAVNTAPAMLAAFTLVGLGVSSLVPLAYRASARVAGRPHGATLATLATVSYLAFLGGPPLIGLLSEQIGLRGALLLVAALGAVLAAVAPVVEARPIFSRARLAARPPSLPPEPSCR